MHEGGGGRQQNEFAAERGGVPVSVTPLGRDLKSEKLQKFNFENLSKKNILSLPYIGKGKS